MGFGLKGSLEDVKKVSSIDERLYSTVYAESAGGSENEISATVDTFLNIADEEGYEKSLKRSSAYNKKSEQYQKAKNQDLNDYEVKAFNEIKRIVDERSSLERKDRLPYNRFENENAFGTHPESKRALSSETIGRQKYYQVPTTGLTQIKLKEKGYDPGEIDGIMGQNTREAIKSFQKDHGLDVDGVAGKNTLKELLSFLNPFSVSEASADELSGGFGLEGSLDGIESEYGGFGLEGSIDAEDPRDSLTFGQKALTNNPVDMAVGAVGKAIDFFRKEEELEKGGLSGETQLKSLDKFTPRTKEERDYETMRMNKYIAKKSPTNMYSGVPSYLDEFAQGILPIRPKELLQPGAENPIARAGGALAGLIATGGMTAGVAPAVSGASFLESLPTVAQIAAGRMAQSGATFSVKTLADNIAEAIAGEDKNAKEVAVETVKQGAFGAGLGLTGAIPKPLIRIPAEATYGFVTSKLEGATNFEAGIQAGVFGLFGMMNQKNLSMAYKNAAEQGGKKGMVDRLVKLGADEAKASEITERYFRYAYSKTGGFDAQKIKNFDDFRKVMRQGGKVYLPSEGTLAKARRSKADQEAYRAWQESRKRLGRPTPEMDVPLHPPAEGKLEASKREPQKPKMVDETQAYHARLKEMATKDLLDSLEVPLHPASDARAIIESQKPAQLIPKEVKDLSTDDLEVLIDNRYESGASQKELDLLEDELAQRQDVDVGYEDSGEFDEIGEMGSLDEVLSSVYEGAVISKTGSLTDRKSLVENIKSNLTHPTLNTGFSEEQVRNLDDEEVIQIAKESYDRSVKRKERPPFSERQQDEYQEWLKKYSPLGEQRREYDVPLHPASEGKAAAKALTGVDKDLVDLQEVSDFTFYAQKGGELYGDPAVSTKTRAVSGNLQSVQSVGPKKAQEILSKAKARLEKGEPLKGKALEIVNEWRDMRKKSVDVSKENDEEIRALAEKYPITQEEIFKIEKQQEELWDEERDLEKAIREVVEGKSEAEESPASVETGEVEQKIPLREAIESAEGKSFDIKKSLDKAKAVPGAKKETQATESEPKPKQEETPKKINAEAIKAKTLSTYEGKNKKIINQAIKNFKARGDAESLSKAEALEGLVSEEAKIKAGSKKEEAIKDFGEKIGGARKDLALKLGGKGSVKKKSSQPAWRTKYIAVERIDQAGWTIIDKTAKRRFSYGPKQEFASQEEAEKAIPLYAVSQNHRVYKGKGDKWEIFKKVGSRKLFKVVNKEFNSREEAMKHMVTNAENILEMKTNFGEEILPVPEIARRTGPQRRKKDADAEMFMNTFAPRGIEFGKWNNQAERQLILNHAYDGLMDLSEVLGVSPKEVMLGGELGIAFGARGQGLSGAKAHYEPSYGVINLTKMKGAGSLAHEWFHALDNYLSRMEVEGGFDREKNARGDLVYKKGRKGRAFLSQGSRYTSLLDKKLLETYRTLINEMFTKAEQYVEDTEKADKFVGTARDGLQKKLQSIRDNLSKDLTQTYTWRTSKKGLKPASAEQLSEFDRLSNIFIEGGDLETKYIYPEKSRSAFGGGRRTNDTLEAMSKIFKAVRGRSGFAKGGIFIEVSSYLDLYKDRLKMLDDAAKKTTKTKKVPTAFAMEAKKMDQARAGNYWSEPPEMAARAFASYVEDKIAENGSQSDFLVYHAHGGVLLPMIDGFVARPYPEGTERESISKGFDAFIKKLQALLKEKSPKRGINLKNEKGYISIPFEWEASIPTKETTGDAFQDHVSYFEDLQLPEDSQIRGLKKRIQQFNGQRLSGKITPVEANRQIARVRGQIIQAAIDEGISIVKTAKGKYKLGMREQSGVYVPEEFSAYTNFKDFKLRAGGLVDTARMMQEIDGSLSVKQKISEPGQAGPVEKYVGWRTRDMLIQKMNFMEQMGSRISGIFKDIKPGSKEDEDITKILDTGLIKGFSAKVIQKAEAMRKVYDELLDMQNDIRVMRGQEPIPYRRNYTSQILADISVWGQLFNKNKEAGDIQSEAFIPDYVMPNQPYNPREMARKGNMPYELMLKSSYELAKRYLTTAGKDIFNTSIIQNNKAFISQLEAMGNKKAAQALANWNGEAFAGVKVGLDKWASLPEGVNWALRKANAVRNLAVFPFRVAWVSGTQVKSLSFTIGRYGYGNTLNGLIKYMNPKNREQLRDVYSYRVKSQKVGKMTEQDSNNLIDGIIDDKRSVVERYNDVGSFILEEVEKLLTGASIFAGEQEGKSRGLKGEALNQYASDAGGKTQSMYNDEDKPGILRSLLVKSIAPYQTFKFEIANSIRELAGKTGTPPDDKREMVVKLLRFASAAFLLRMLSSWASEKDMRDITNPVPFSQWTIDPIVDKAIGRRSYEKATLPSLVGMASELTDGVVRSIEEKKVDRKLRNTLIKYVPGMFGIGGGGQAANAIDTLIAYSEGGIRDKSGRLMFRVEKDDISRGIYSGIWTTTGGKEYIEKRFIAPKFLREDWANPIFRKKNLYPTTVSEWKKLPESLKKKNGKKLPGYSLLLKSETRPRKALFIDTPRGKKIYEKLLNQ